MRMALVLLRHAGTVRKPPLELWLGVKPPSILRFQGVFTSPSFYHIMGLHAGHLSFFLFKARRGRHSLAST